MTFMGLMISKAVKNELDEFTSNMSDTLDQLAYSEEKIDFDEYGETLLSKLQVKCNRLYEMVQNKAKINKEEKDAVQALVSDIAHQVKTPITNIKMYHQILADREIPKEKQREFYKRIEGQIDKLDFLINAMVKLSRLESGVVSVSPKPTSIQNMILDAFETVSTKAKEKQLTLTMEQFPDHEVMADPQWTLEALTNLLENAVKYTPLKGSVTVSVDHWEMYTKINISDTGIGISEKEQGAIFNRFYRSSEVREIEGLGIGLYLTREILQRESGFIELSSNVGEGSTFSVFLLNA